MATEQEIRERLPALLAELPSLLGMTIRDYFSTGTNLKPDEQEGIAQYGDMTLHEFTMLMVTDQEIDLNETLGWLEQFDRKPLNHLSIFYELYCGACHEGS
jgi:hypothetical protein